MLDAVKRLERHVQVLETKYKDYIQQKDAEAVSGTLW